MQTIDYIPLAFFYYPWYNLGISNAKEPSVAHPHETNPNHLPISGRRFTAALTAVTLLASHASPSLSNARAQEQPASPDQPVEQVLESTDPADPQPAAPSQQPAPASKPEEKPSAPPTPPKVETPAPPKTHPLADRAATLLVQTASSWAGRQMADGRFRDPVLGTLPYGVPKTAQALIEAGRLTNNPALVSAGIKGLSAEIKFPNEEGFNVGSEVAGMANAFAWNERELASNPDWQTARTDILEFLQERSNFKVGKSYGDGVKKCFENSKCYYNLKLVKSLADIELRAAGIKTSGRATASSINKLPHLSTSAILKQASGHTGKTSARLGDSVSFEGVGILSDPPHNPLAYSAFSSMILARIVDRQGGYEKTSPSVKAMFERSTKALLGLMSPAGDVSYIGRGQGQVWNIAAAADAFAVAAKYTRDPVWQGRYLAGVDRALDRLETVHTPGKWGMPLVPRLKNDQNPDYKGIDRYANTAAYNGLALFALGNTMRSLNTIPDAALGTLPADENGVFIDKKDAKFAAVTRNGLWYAIHGSTTHSDARYGFGLVAANKKNARGVWEPAIPQRPYTKAESPGGPSIIKGGEQYVPVASRITADKNGAVQIRGGWAKDAHGEPTLDRSTAWSFKPESNGVSMSFRAKGNRSYQFQVWRQSGAKVRLTKRSVEVTERDGSKQKYIFNRPISVKRGSGGDSAFDEGLKSSIITTRAKSGQTVSFKTKF